MLNNPLKYVDPLGLEPLLGGGVSELTRQQRKFYTPATNSRGAVTNSWSCPVIEDLQRGLQQAGSGFITGIRQVSRENFLQSYNVAKEYLPEGAKIYVIEGHIGQENYFILTDGQISSEDLLAAAGAGAGVIFTIAPSGKVSGKILGKVSKGTGKAGKNTNPFKGSVTDDVIVVDPAGNAMPLKPGQQIQGRPDSKMWQVKDQYGKPTGERFDGLGHPKQVDPKAQLPHGHRVDKFGSPIVDEFGNPHLPVYPPNW